MKKIVALVLSLVMVLGLATTAFADVTTTTLKGTDGYSIYAVDGTTAEVSKTAIDKVVTGNSVAADGTVTYTATMYNVVGGDKFAEVDASSASHKLVKDGAIVAYLYKTNAVSTSKVVDKAVASVKSAVATCGDYAHDAEHTVYVVGDKAYFADGAFDWAVYNGKFVALGNSADASIVKHAYAANTYAAADGAIATVKCTVCKNVYNVLTAKQVAAMAPSAFTTWNNLYVATGVVADAPAAGDKVESAETFDAGIAMYVGMSVMAAAGSAVVLKKKD